MFDRDLYYSNKETKGMLKHYQFLNQEAQIDIDRALNSDLISGQMFLLLYLHYAQHLSLITTAKVMGLNLKEIMELNEETLECIEALLNGYRTAKRKKKHTITYNTLDKLSAQQVSPFDPDLDVPLFLLEHDELGREVLRQRVEVYQYEPQPYSEKLYPIRPIDENADGFELDRFLVKERQNNGVRSIHDGE